MSSETGSLKASDKVLETLKEVKLGSGPFIERTIRRSEDPSYAENDDVFTCSKALESLFYMSIRAGEINGK